MELNEDYQTDSLGLHSPFDRFIQRFDLLAAQHDAGYNLSARSDAGFESDGVLASQSTRGWVGRPPGIQGKRKAESDLSTNPRTVKSRLRTATLHPQEKQLEQSKRADISAISYHLRPLKKSMPYEHASDEEKQTLIEGSGQSD